MRPLVLIGLWLGLVALSCGCAPRVACLDNLGVLDPETGSFLIFDKCSGDMYIDYLPGKNGQREGRTPDENIPNFDENSYRIES